MNDVVPEFGGGVSAIFGGGGRRTDCRDPMRIPSAVNDDSPRPNAEPAQLCLSLFLLDFVEVEGQILLAMKFDGNVTALRALRRTHGRSGAESAINTIFLDDLFDTDKYTEDTLIEFGTVICRSLRARAAQTFPGRSFVAELFSVDHTGRVGVRLYQEGSQNIDG